MFPERRLLNEELNVFNRIVVTGMCIIIVLKIIWISQTIVTHCANFQVSIPITYDIVFNLLNNEWDTGKLLTVATVRFLKRLLIAALLKLYLTPQGTNEYSSSPDSDDYVIISS